MVKLADTPDLGSGSARIRGSSPLSGIFRVIGWESASREAIQSRGVKRVRFGGSSGEQGKICQVSRVAGRIHSSICWRRGSWASGGERGLSKVVVLARA